MISKYGIWFTFSDEKEHFKEIVFTRTEAQADEYYMKHPRRGKAIIFNHEIFDKEDRREGTHFDVEKLKLTLEKLKFEIEVCDDYEYSDIKDKIKNCKYAKTIKGWL